ncbi:DUF6985 domain-containing protein [Armatimonas rosea]|uniref:DUF6985 domain-containing protein n=1 Tax=Armatimonas rosea TaxID=685828 RepID=UPI00160A45EE
MTVPVLGDLTRDSRFPEWLESEAIEVPVLGTGKRRFVLENYEKDKAQEEFQEAIANFLKLSPVALKAAEEPIFRYYQDVAEDYDDEDFEEAGIPPLTEASEVWEHIQLAEVIHVSRRPYGDKKIYLSLSCGCDWEEEHGLMIVFKQGLFVNKVGGYDGHLTNSDAYGSSRFEDVVYREL